MSNPRVDIVTKVVNVPNFTELAKKSQGKFVNVPKDLETERVKVTCSQVGAVPRTITISGPKDQEADIDVITTKVEQLLKLEPKERSHFISIPLTQKPFQDAYKEFKKMAQSINPDLEDALFITPNKLHLGLGHFFLQGKRKDEAKKVFLENIKDIVEKHVGKGNKLSITINGFGCTTARGTTSLKKTNLVYGKVESDKLQAIQDDIQTLFTEKELMDPELQAHVLDGKLILLVPLISISSRRFAHEYARQIKKRLPDPKGDFWTFNATKFVENLDFTKEVNNDQIHFYCFPGNQRNESGYFIPMAKVKL